MELTGDGALHAVFKYTGFQQKCMHMFAHLTDAASIGSQVPPTQKHVLGEEYMQHQTCKDNGCCKQRYGQQLLHTPSFYDQLCTAGKAGYCSN
jgi:hypothetical protein